MPRKFQRHRAEKDSAMVIEQIEAAEREVDRIADGIESSMGIAEAAFHQGRRDGLFTGLIAGAGLGIAIACIIMAFV